MAILTKLPSESPLGKSGFNAASIVPTDLFLQTGALQVDYFLEEVNGTNKTLIPLPSQPQNVMVRRIYSERPIYTFDPEFAYREVSAPRIVEVELQGQTGLHLRLGIDENGDINFTEGYNHLANFEKFLDKYHFHAASHATPVVYSVQSLQNDFDYEARPYLVFRGIKENLAGRCYITSLNYQRSVEQHRLGSFQWSLILRIYDTADARPDPTRFAMMQSLDNATAAVNSLTGLSEAVQQSFQAGIGQVARGAGGVVDAVSGLAVSISRIDNTIYGTVGTLATVVGKVINCFDAIGGLFDGDAYKRDFFQAVDSYETAVVDNWTRRKFFEAVLAKSSRKVTDQWSFPPEPTDDEVEIQIGSQAQALTMQEMLYQGWLATGPLGMDTNRRNPTEVYGFLKRHYGFSAMALFNNDRDYQPEARQKTTTYNISYELRAGETLLTVANRFMGSPSRWNELAALNDAQDAYTKTDGTPFAPGDIVLIPAIGAEFQTMDADMNSENIYTDLIGVDFEIYEGDINYSRNGDVHLAMLVQNLKQSIERILKTAMEEVTFDPKYGAKLAIIGSKINSTTAQLAAQRVREGLLRDSRILDVTNIQVEVDPDHSDTLNLSLTCVCVGQNDINVNIPIQP